MQNPSSWKDRRQIASSMDDDDIDFLSKKSEEVIEPVLQETAPSLSLQEQFPLHSRLYQRRNAICGINVMRWDETDILTEKKEKRKTFSGMMSDINKGMSAKTRNLYPLDDFLSKKLDSVEEVKERREPVRQETTPSVRLQERLPLNNRAFTEKTIKINLQKHQNTFGFSISGGVEKKQPVTVFQVTIGSAADICDLQMKDIILSVNRRDASYMRLSQVQHIINNAARTGRVELKIKREIGGDLDNPKEDLLQHMQTEETTVRHARGIVVGCAGAGKTTLLYSLIGKSLDEIKKVKSTRGLQVYEHIFTVTDGSLHAAENLERKFLVRVPRSLLTKKNDKSEDADQTEEDNIGDLSKLNGTNDICEEKTETLGAEEINIDLTSDVKVVEHSTTASDTKAKDTVAETLSPEVMKKILDAQENEISVSMIDFAGQFAYYACHQIYMRSSAFYILVMDMTKSFEDDVISEEEEQKGSVFGTWKYKEYIEFWLNSIKSFGGPEAPVLIVATHTEDRTDDDIDDYFTCLWRSLPEEDKTWLSKHRSEENEFAFELININEDERRQKLQLLKKALVEVVSNKLDTKIPVRSSWAFLEHLLQDSGKPIISYEEIQEMNRKVPEQYRLESEEEIPTFLTFFHDHGILLYFNGEATQTHAILSLQWFSNAFSRLIADKKHVNKDCKRRHIKEWELFNQTGELKTTLVDALWKDEKVEIPNEQSYKEYKTELMSYMERLRMLVSIGDTAEAQAWYVPCMNKKPFTKDIIKANLKCSSILCFRFTSFAIFVFYRLIAYCMSSLNLKVVPDKRDICLFQTAAVFEYKNHTVLLGICDKDIQLQVVTHSLDIKTEVSCEVGNLIHKALDELTETFENKYLTFQRGYKCQMIFCDQNDTSFTPEEELCEVEIEEIQCSCCPMGEKHLIKVHQTRRFWEKVEMSVSTTPDSSELGLQGRSRFAKLGMATNDVLNQAYRDILEIEIPPSDVESKVKASSVYKRLRTEQEHLLVDAKHHGYKNFDISLTYTLIRNICKKIPLPTKRKWGEEPLAGEITIGDDVERIRSIRNSLTAHVSTASTPETEFDDTWSTVTDICQRLESFTGKKYLDKLNDIKMLTIKREDEDLIIGKLYMEHQEMFKTLMSDVQEVKSDVKDIKIAVLKPDSTGAMNDS